jgi:hypothetical protein
VKRESERKRNNKEKGTICVARSCEIVYKVDENEKKWQHFQMEKVKENAVSKCERANGIVE